MKRLALHVSYAGHEPKGYVFGRVFADVNDRCVSHFPTPATIRRYGCSSSKRNVFVEPLENDVLIVVDRESNGEGAELPCNFLGLRVPKAGEIVLEQMKSIWIAHQPVEDGRKRFIDYAMTARMFHLLSEIRAPNN